MPQTFAVRKAEEELKARLAGHKHILPLLQRGSLEGVRIFVLEVNDFFSDLGRRAGLPPDKAPVITSAVVHDAFPSLLCYRRGHPDVASRILLARWRAYLGESPISVKLLHCVPEPEDSRLLSVFSAVVSGLLIAQAQSSRGQAILARLMESLRLSYDQLGRMLGVSGETARRWAQGVIAVPEAQLAKLDVADAALTRLLSIFRPDRLPEVVRRLAELFDGQSALDWILTSRIRDVADRYDLLTRYQA